MDTIKFIFENIDNIITWGVIIAVVVTLIKRGETETLKELLFSFITRAEREYGAGTGALKFSAVASWLNEQIPALIRPLFTSSNISNLIEEGLEAAKIEWKKEEYAELIQSISDNEIKNAVNSAADNVIK